MFWEREECLICFGFCFDKKRVSVMSEREVGFGVITEGSTHE